MDQVERSPIKEWVGKTASAGRWSEGSEGSEAGLLDTIMRYI